MLVVSDTSPLIVLIKIRHLQILPALFSRVVIPTAVAVELSAEGHQDDVAALIQNPPSWLEIRLPKIATVIPTLDLGESQAIHLAREIKASLLLIYEAKGRKIAVSQAVAITGIVGVLERAARAGLIDLGDAFERVKQIDFWIPHHFLGQRLAAFREGK